MPNLVEVIVTKPGKRVPYGLTFDDVETAFAFARLCYEAGMKPDVSPVFRSQESAQGAFEEVEKYFEGKTK